MKFEFFDPELPLSINILLVTANVINLVYNIPQIVHTYKTKSTRDFSGWFLSLRIVGNAIWVVYAIYISNLLLLINNVVTVAASVFVAWYKVKEILAKRRIPPLDIAGYKDTCDSETENMVTFDNDSLHGW